MGRAPLCSYPGCTRPTWDTVCWQHRNAATAPATAGPSPSAPTLDQRNFGTVGECWESVSRAFPEVSDVVHPHNVRQQVEQTLRSAVSVEVYRRFSTLDQPDLQQREHLSQILGVAMVEGARSTPNSLTPDEAEEVLYSSTDRYGRSMEGSAALAAYGLRCEWELANLQGVETDPDGIPYRLSFDKFCELAGERTQAPVAEQYRLELGRFHDIIRDLHGRPPLHPAPMALGLTPEQIYREPDPVEEEAAIRRAAEEAYAQAVAERDIEEARRRQERHDMAKRVVKGIAIAGVSRALDLDGSRARRDEQRRREQADREWAEVRRRTLADLDRRDRARAQRSRERVMNRFLPF